MAGSSEKVQKAFDEGRFLDVLREAKSRRNPEDKLLAGVSLFRLGRYGEALEVLDRIARQAQSLTRSLYYLALIHRQRGDEETARALLQKYLAVYPEDDEARDTLEGKPSAGGELMKEPSLELAKVYAQQGHYEQALDIYAQVNHMGALDEASRQEALGVQNLYLRKTLEGWLMRLKR
ncbi:MAG TPA: tetratricopeptide repeat protein [Deltaproteobacteria bacterium]|nr:tetratricopeptide repeat protein [Deltaproteobacteria bacterium]HQI80617.1 tetratricopeptide repeat protein [Deltaproteobacteria bacterium]